MPRARGERGDVRGGEIARGALEHDLFGSGGKGDHGWFRVEGVLAARPPSAPFGGTSPKGEEGASPPPLGEVPEGRRGRAEAISAP